MERYFRALLLNRTSMTWMAPLLCGIVVVWAPSLPAAHPVAATQRTTEESSLLNGFRHVEAASVSDAEEKILGRRMYMSHRMRPIFPSKFAGFALTVQLKKAEGGSRPKCVGGYARGD
jgi:hypothetical protein